MENRFANKKVEKLSHMIGDVINSNLPENEKKENVVQLLFFGAKDDLFLFAERVDTEANGTLELDIKESKDGDNEVVKSLVVYISDEVPFEKMMRGEGVVLYAEIPILMLIKMMEADYVNQLILESMEGKIILMKNNFSAYADT